MTSHLSLLPFCFAVLLLVACKQEASQKTSSKQSRYATTGKIERFHPLLDSIIAFDANIEILAEGFEWTEGPLWIKDGAFLLFTDIPPNRVMRWKEGEGTSIYLTPSGYTGEQARTGEPGANGLLLDGKGLLVLCQHGDRRVARMNAPLQQPRPEFTTLADRWDGKQLNSPNDAVFDSKGRLYFTDPPYGLEKQMDDPFKEIPFQGVYLLQPNGTLDLLVDSLTRPNGIAFSPDERTLYVANSDPNKAIWVAYDVRPDGMLGHGRLFHDATSKVSKEMPGLPDGLKVNAQGIIFATGPGGVWVFHPDGTVLGRIDTGQATSNCAFGNEGKALYLTADDYLMRVWLK
ncbi:MAG: SMP-30/gluconolactonase/LRE family protein [Saprospiraceae bacterium]|nr:SMP-30/gluconolactonase/LRE family protein [Saprospiraceae bacterium]